MSHHVPDDLLVAFVEGDVGEQLAVHIAEHLDACPQCLNQAAQIEPLNQLFAALDDPEPPADLMDAILAEAMRPDRLPRTELAVGLTLLAAAGLFAAELGNPVRLATDFGLVLSALGDGARILAVGLAGSNLGITLGTLAAGAGLVLTARMAKPIDVPLIHDTRRLL